MELHYLSFFFFFLGPNLRHMEVEVKWELQLLAYTRATATQDLSCVFDLHHSSQQRQILNPLSEARDRTHILMDTSRVHIPLSHNSQPFYFVNGKVKVG